MKSKANYAKNKLDKFIPLVEKELAKILSAHLKEISQNFTPFATQLTEEFKALTLSKAKRLRASFVYYAYKMFGGKDEKSILTVASAIELLHMYLLVVDDVMDLADFRRGYPTLHKTFSAYHQKNHFKYDQKHFGDMVAINTALQFCHFSLNLINRTNFNASLKQKVINQVNLQLMTTSIGQNYDLFNEASPQVTKQDIINVLYWKTGLYTYHNPIQIGAILAGASQQQLEALFVYGKEGGSSFQIQDDILGVFGDSSKTGKSTEDDIKEGKQTLLTWYVYKHGNKKDVAFLDATLGKKNATAQEIQHLREIMRKVGALDYAKEKSLKMVLKAKKSLLNNYDHRWKKEGVDYLLGIADFMIERDL